MNSAAETSFPKERWDICATLTKRSEVTEIKGSFTPPNDQNSINVEDLPLIIRQDQCVRFEDQYYSLNDEGLYRFVNWGKVRYDDPTAKPEIIDRRKSSSSVIVFKDDILTLLASLASLCVHGHPHDDASHEERLARMKLGAVAMTCGNIARFSCRILHELGWKARMVQCLRIEGVYDTYNCGHLLLEFYWPKYGKWVLADVDTHQMFVNNGEYLNLAEVKDLIHQGWKITLEPLTIPGIGLIDTTETVTTDFTGMALFYHILLDPELLKEWFRRMFAAVALDDSGIFYCADPAGRERVGKYYPESSFLDRDEWYKRFYENGG